MTTDVFVSEKTSSMLGVLIIVVFVFCVAMFSYNYFSGIVVHNLSRELACDKALEEGILFDRTSDVDCDVNWHGSVVEINFFCEKVMPSFCDFNLVALNETGWN